MTLCLKNVSYLECDLAFQNPEPNQTPSHSTDKDLHSNSEVEKLIGQHLMFYLFFNVIKNSSKTQQFYLHFLTVLNLASFNGDLDRKAYLSHKYVSCNTEGLRG